MCVTGISLDHMAHMAREWCMPLFICRWQDGDFSAVSAASRDEAMELLDEVGNADVADLFTLKNFMVHFQPKTEVDNMEEPVPVELEGFGEGTYEMLCERVYPVYSKVSGKVVDDLPTTGEMPTETLNPGRRQINSERARPESTSQQPRIPHGGTAARLMPSQSARRFHVCSKKYRSPRTRILEPTQRALFGIR